MQAVNALLEEMHRKRIEWNQKRAMMVWQREEQTLRGEDAVNIN